MSQKKVHDKQPDKFEFTESNLKLAQKILGNYPESRKKKCSYAFTSYCTRSK